VSGTLDDDPRNGWTTETHDPLKPYAAIFALREPLVLDENQELIFVLLHRSTRGDANIGRFKISTCSEPGRAVRSFNRTPLERLAALGEENQTEAENQIKSAVLEQFLTRHVAYQKAKKELNDANRQLSRFKSNAGDQRVMVLQQRKAARKTFVLTRGVWDQKGDEVDPGFPQDLFAPLTIEPTSRLELARWLVSRDNPLTARVIVNQLWQICFGNGLVRTPDDFGLRGEFPTHPELLDWLAVEFMENNWDVKHILKLIVTSQAYQQSSEVNARNWSRDPENRRLTRMTRYRLPSWMIHDSVLRTSRLLNLDLGGATVMPYQPDGIWAEIFMGRFRYEPSQGSYQFRRTLYAF
ncbi:MAG: DUF1553 domain-containing protein, partial [Planctomycetota bacterium]|nr:DUF1553 domain-containing protein [Planctomycetota bacterium]